MENQVENQGTEKVTFVQAAEKIGKWLGTFGISVSALISVLGLLLSYGYYSIIYKIPLGIISFNASSIKILLFEIAPIAFAITLTFKFEKKRLTNSRATESGCKKVGFVCTWCLLFIVLICCLVILRILPESVQNRNVFVLLLLIAAIVVIQIVGNVKCFRNSKIIRKVVDILSAFGLLGMVYIVISILFIISTYPKHNYAIVQQNVQNDCVYVAVYESKDYFILEAAEIDEEKNVLVIDTSRQRLEKISSSIEYQYQVFDDVIIMQGDVPLDSNQHFELE